MHSDRAASVMLCLILPSLLICYHYCRVFPWVLGVFEVSAYHFYKLIEVAIKVETNLPRSIIKHLNRVSPSN